MTESLIIVLQSGLSLTLSAALAAFVSLQRPHTLLHRLVLAVLLSFLAWTTGLLLVFGAGENPAYARLGLFLVIGGIMTSSSLWFYLCATLSRLPAAIDHPRAMLFAILAPAAVSFAALLSDTQHGLFAGGESIAVFTTPAASWAGPFFWIHILWSYLCTGGSIALCLRAAWRASDSIERKRLLSVALATTVPAVSIAIALAGWLPEGWVTTPADLGVSACILVTAIARYRFLESSPLPAREVIAHLREALLLGDAEGVIVDANPAAEELLGESTSSLRGRTLKSVVRQLDPDDGSSEPPVLISRGKVSLRNLTTRDGRVFDISSGWVADDQNRSIGSFLVVYDRTEQHLRERFRLQTQRLESLGVMAAGIAHEINNPLAFVRTNLAHLAQLGERIEKRLELFEPEEAEDLAEISEVISETQSGIDRISRIVEATRRLSRDPGSRRTPVDLNQTARSALQIAETHPRRDVTVESHLTEPLPKLYGSEERLGQVLLNLLINAKQAVGQKRRGLVRIETRVREGWVEARVEDNGPGVAPADREHIFDPFFTTKAPDEGTGLGLAIAFEIAKEHAGTLSVDDSDLGGACFTLKLPTVPSPTSA